MLIDGFDPMEEKKIRMLSVRFLSALLLEILPGDLKLMFPWQK